MRALSIRQPYAELILRGIKTAELRPMPTRILGERFYIYATKQLAHSTGSRQAAGSGQQAVKSGGIWSRDLAVPGEPLPQWMIELAEQVKLIEPGALLPTGVIVGSAVIDWVEQVEEARRQEGAEARRDEDDDAGLSPSCLRAYVPSCLYKWHLTDVRRSKHFRKPTRHPQPSWFNPFN